MAALVCEICGGKLIGKAGGIFACDSCGMEYSKEWAQEKIQEIRGSVQIEGSVDVTGSTVMVDNTAFVEKYLQNARRAKDKEDWEETEKYYNLVEQNDPTNIEAIFYSAYGKTKSSLLENDVFKREATFKVLQNCVSIIDDNYDVSKESEEILVVEQISNDIIALCSSSYVYTQTTKGSNFLTQALLSSDDRYKTEILFDKLQREFCTTLENIIAKYVNKECDAVIKLYGLALIHANSIDSSELKTKYSTELVKIDNAVKEEKRNTYWAEHQTEKVEIEKEIESLNCAIKALKDKFDSMEAHSELSALENECEDLQKKLNSLGIFKNKEKKELQDKINHLNEKIVTLKSDIDEESDAVNAQISVKEKRITVLKEELTKDR